jgi:hypothetical protein
MKKAVKSLIILWIIFFFGLFSGEWLLDFIFGFYRDSLKAELMQSLFVGFFCAFMIVINQKSLRNLFN